MEEREANVDGIRCNDIERPKGDSTEGRSGKSVMFV